MREKLESIIKRHNILSEEMSDPKIYSDQSKLTPIAKEHSSLEQIVIVGKKYISINNQILDHKDIRVNLYNNDGKTPLLLAAEFGQTKVIELFAQYFYNYRGDVIQREDLKYQIVELLAKDKFYKADKNLFIRMPNATRPWQHVIEPIFGYLYLAERLFYDKTYKFSGAWNFAPNLKNNLKVKELVNFGKGFFKSKSKIIISKKKHYESTNLSLSSEKAKKKLGWKNIYDAKDSLRITFGWYKYYYDNVNKSKSKIIDFSFNQIENYFKKLGIPFTRAKVGDRYVLELLQEKGWELGGEGSGHIICLDKHSTGDGIISALQVLHAMKDANKTLAELLRGVALYPQQLINIKIITS